MTVELARRLIESGVPLADIEAALLLVVERGLSLSRALSRVEPGLLSRVEQELARSELPAVVTVRASPELFARLPAGMCQRLLALPVHVDPRTGRVDVAAVEPLDPHIAQEFAYHLGQPVRILQASLEAVDAALLRVQQSPRISVPPQALAVAQGIDAADAATSSTRREVGTPSDAPIPLVRRSMPPLRPHGPPAPPSALSEADGVSRSWRSKPPPADLLSGGELARPPLAAPLAGPDASSENAKSTRERFEAAASPDAVVDLLRDCLAPLASIVFAVRSASFDGRVASPTIEQRVPARRLSLLSGQPSVLETAVKSGFYLGPIPSTPNHRELRDALDPNLAQEVYVTAIIVSDRPSLVWLIAGFEQSLELTRRADEIALSAGRALARIVRQRKRGT